MKEMREYVNQNIKRLTALGDKEAEQNAYMEMAELLIETYKIDNFPLHHNEYFILADYFGHVGNDNAKLAILGASFVNSLTSMSQYGEYFAVLELMNICQILMKVNHIHSAKRVYKMVENWVEEEFKDSVHYETLKYSLAELHRFISD